MSLDTNDAKWRMMVFTILEYRVVFFVSRLYASSLDSEDEFSNGIQHKADNKNAESFERA